MRVFFTAYRVSADKTVPSDDCGGGGDFVDDNVAAWAVKEVLITVAKDFA